MRGNTYNNPGPTSQGNAYSDPYGYNQGQGAPGFTKHEVGNARKAGNANPLKSVASRIGDTVGNIQGKIQDRGGAGSRQSQNARRSADDYLGTGQACRVCGNPVDEAHDRCPHCGALRVPFYKNIPVIVTVVATILAIVLLSLAINACSNSTGIGPTGSDIPANAATSQERKALQTSISTAQKAIDAQKSSRPYTAYSISLLQTAVNDAKSISNNRSAESSSVIAATSSVQTAYAGLVPMPERGAYEWYPYGVLRGGIDSFAGKSICYEATVQETSSGSSSTTARVAINGAASDVMYVTYDSKAVEGKNPVVGSSIVIYGTISGSYAYASASGQTYVPMMIADAVVFVS